MAGDFAAAARLPADLQIVARMAVESRLTSLRRYERSGGAAILLHSFFRGGRCTALADGRRCAYSCSRPSRKLNRR